MKTVSEYRKKEMLKNCFFNSRKLKKMKIKKVSILMKNHLVTQLKKMKLMTMMMKMKRKVKMKMIKKNSSS